MTILRAATVPVEIAHRGLDGVLHGHSLTAEVWTATEVDLDAWKREVAAIASEIEGQVEETIGGRSFEDIAETILTRLPSACRVVIRLPTRGHAIEVTKMSNDETPPICPVDAQEGLHR